MKTVLFLLLLCPLLSWAQTTKITPADLQRKHSFLLMRDGSVLRGQILRQDSTIISVRRRGGEMSFVEADQVVRITAANPEQYTSTVPLADAVLSQPTGLDRVFVLKDGTQVEGRFVRRDSTMITVRKRNGQLTYFEPELLVRTDSVGMAAYSDEAGIFPNRFSPWVLAGLTAYNPEGGRFYYRNTWLLFNELQYGITRFWSVGAKFVTPLPYLVLNDGYYGAGQYLNSIAQFNTKFSAALSPDFHLALNAAFQAGGNQFSEMGGRWLLQTLATVGSSQQNVTFGYGIVVPKLKYYTYQPPYSSTLPRTISIKIPNHSFLSLGIMQKIGRNLTFLSDNSINLGPQYYTDNTTGARATLSAALRIDRQRHAFDLGMYTLIYEKPFLWNGDRSTRFFPYIGYNLLIGRD